MKINWGTGIVIAFIAFISFILFFVIKMSTGSKPNHNLVTDDYYKQELEYQKEIDAQNLAISNSYQLQIIKNTEGLSINFPDSIDLKKITGTIYCYRPSNNKLDFETPIKLNSTQQIIANDKLLSGRWDLKVYWKYQSENYLSKKSITY